MATYRIDLAYDGSDFRGYAVQPNVRTVQGALEAQLSLHIPDIVTIVAGRTDAGVHAT
ncbi:tRNA pseudouridine synthase A [bacterium BMS3Bbin02]|nr:tRNA pseudouridine synthase A [bacterium BMS3Bbin02]